MAVCEMLQGICTVEITLGKRQVMNKNAKEWENGQDGRKDK